MLPQRLPALWAAPMPVTCNSTCHVLHLQCGGLPGLVVGRDAEQEMVCTSKTSQYIQTIHIAFKQHVADKHLRGRHAAYHRACDSCATCFGSGPDGDMTAWDMLRPSQRQRNILLRWAKHAQWWADWEEGKAQPPCRRMRKAHVPPCEARIHRTLSGSAMRADMTVGNFAAHTEDACLVPEGAGQ
jgi:hypothetical protein